jgi:hypothetical protein
MQVPMAVTKTLSTGVDSLVLPSPLVVGTGLEQFLNHSTHMIFTSTASIDIFRIHRSDGC